MNGWLIASAIFFFYGIYLIATALDRIERRLRDRSLERDSFWTAIDRLDAKLSMIEEHLLRIAYRREPPSE